ncbi:heme o synthase [Neptuniibacter halophilus]|uniref:heme o synthase n=1 Tax=Neptuniibacter halophilus TaxID=651666 RepID=UPI0025732BD3|nr:heme o synthase [Neptuniibacter halophilus]
MPDTRAIAQRSMQITWRDYITLCKPKVVLVMLITAAVGMFLALPGLPPLDKVLFGLIGIALASGSAAAVNHVMDRKIDENMARTKGRPLPQGKLTPQQAMLFAAVIGIAGIVMLVYLVNPLTAWLTVAALMGYAVVYTVWLKRATPQNIVIGGIAGAAPPLLGWTAITGSIEPDALLLVLIIFAWTPPHFWALCIARKADYEKAGIPMLPVTHGDEYTRLQILLYSLLMVSTTLFPYMTGMSGLFYLSVVMLLNIRFLYWNWRLWNRPAGAPMALFRYSINYIMLLFAALLVDHYLTGQLGS